MAESGLLVEHRVEVGGELVHQLLADVAHDSPAELGDLAGDVQVGLDDALGRTGVDRFELRGDQGAGVALAGGVAALALQHGAVGRVVALDEVGLALERSRDRTELDLHDAAEHVAFDLLQLGAGHARGDALDVGEHGPGLIDRPMHREFVQKFVHRPRSSNVSMSAAEPMHATSSIQSG